MIKGRGLTTFEQYADCARPGRLIRLNVDDRRAVWAMFQAYERALHTAGIGDFQDQVLLAETALQKQSRRRATRPSSSTRRRTSRWRWCGCCTPWLATDRMRSP